MGRNRNNSETTAEKKTMITAKLRNQLNTPTLRKSKQPGESKLQRERDVKVTSHNSDYMSVSRNDKYLLNLKIVLRCTSETFTATNCSIRMKISELKSLLEFVTGIPSHIQRLRYLDEGELIDNKDLLYYDVIDGATLNLDVFTIYVHLVKAVVMSNFDDVLRQGVSTQVEWSAPVADYMYQREKVDYIASRAAIALFIAAHRGRLEIVEGLIRHNVDLNYVTGCGRTAVMVSVVAGQTDIIHLLLKNNADVDIKDMFGQTAIDIAKQFNNKIGQHTLIEFKWRKRAEAEMKTKLSKPDANNKNQRPGFQMFDSAQKTWLKGDYAQVYMMQLEPETEFSGSGFSAPKNTRLRDLDKRREERKNISDISAITFDKWLLEKKRSERNRKIEEAENRIATSKEAANGGRNGVNLKYNSEQNIYDESLEDIMNQQTVAGTTAGTITDQKQSKKLNNDPFDIFSTNTATATIAGNTQSSLTRNELNNLTSRQRNIKMYRIHDGMSYEEWIQIRDNFLQSHNLV